MPISSGHPIAALFVACLSTLAVAVNARASDANGILFDSEPGFTRAFFSVETSRGSLRSISLSPDHQIAAAVPKASRGRIVGRLHVYIVGGPALNYPLRMPSERRATVTLSHRSGIMVRFREGARGAHWALRVDELPAQTGRVEIELAGPGGPILRQRHCQNYQAVGLRTARSGASATRDVSKALCAA